MKDNLTPAQQRLEPKTVRRDPSEAPVPVTPLPSRKELRAAIKKGRGKIETPRPVKPKPQER